MHRKNIKLIIRKQLKKKYPNWKRLNKKKKKAIARLVLEEACEAYDFKQEIEASLEELVGIEEQFPANGIMNLEEMARFIDDFNSSTLIKLTNKRSSLHIHDPELKFIDELFDNQIISRLLSYDGYSPCLRSFFPCNLFRAELLKAVKYPEISYRKYCDEEYMGRDRKQNRAFIGLSLRRNQMIDHTQLSQFRSSLTFTQMANLLVYTFHHFYQSGLLGDCILHGVDSTELANYCKIPLASIEVKGKKIRIYDDIDCDCGKRRNKRDKSPYVVGYRLHTLTAINAKTGHSFPMVSLLTAANHHDSNFLVPLVKLAQAMGIDLKLITADEAYHDSDGSFFKETGVHLITPPSSKVSLPENVDLETKSVVFDEMCDTPMIHVGCYDQNHEFKCGASPGECFRSSTCPQCRVIPLDNGHFQRIPNGSDQADEALDIRKNIERPFNLLKNQEGLEQVRVRSQHGLLARSVFSTIGALLLEMAGTRRKEKKTEKQQMELFDKAA